MNTIAACSEWRENLQGNDGESNPGNKRGKFCSFGYFEGVPQRIDTELFHEDTGIYEGNPHDALVLSLIHISIRSPRMLVQWQQY